MTSQWQGANPNPAAELKLPLWASLRLRAAMTALLVVLCMSIAYSFNTSRLINERGRIEVDANLRQVAELLNLVTAPYAAIGNFAVLADFFDEMLLRGDHKGLIYIVISSKNGQRLFSAGVVPSVLPAADLDIEGAIHNGIVHSQNPILLQGNQVGTLQFGISTKHIVETQQSIFWEGLMISAIISLLALSILLTAGFRLVRRVKRLTQASQEIAGGHYGTGSADESGHDEIALLAHNFNLMAVALSCHLAEVEASRKKVEELNATLEAMVDRRTRQLAERNIELATTIDNLNQTRESLTQSEKLASLGAIVAGVAHELNTPIGNALTVASAYAEHTRTFAKEMETGLKRSALNQYVESSRSAADLIFRNLDRAANLIQSFKQVAVDQSSEQWREFNLSDIIEENLLLLQPMLKKTPFLVEVEVPAELKMQSYPGPLGQALINFINNAILHGFNGRDHGTIRIRAKAIDKDSLELSIADNGKGIPEEYLERIFEPFFTTRMGHGGSGLGLSVAFNIITKLLGGTIEVHSRPNECTTFLLVLPTKIPKIARRAQ